MNEYKEGSVGFTEIFPKEPGWSIPTALHRQE